MSLSRKVEGEAEARRGLATAVKNGVKKGKGDKERERQRNSRRDADARSASFSLIWTELREEAGRSKNS